MRGLKDIDYVLRKLDWMRVETIWPNGLRYLWTDAFGLVLLVSLHEELGEARFLAEAEWLVAEVDRVLGRTRGIRIGEEPDRDGQYFHYLAMWLYALAVLGRHKPGYRDRGISLARDIHAAFVVPGRGVWWKMMEDLSGPYPGCRRPRCVRWLCVLSFAERGRTQSPNRRHARTHRADCAEAVDYPGSRDRRDALDDAFLSSRAVGAGAAAPLSRHVGSDVEPGRLFLSGATPGVHAIRLHELWSIRRPAGDRRDARSCRQAQRIL